MPPAGLGGDIKSVLCKVAANLRADNATFRADTFLDYDVASHARAENT
jgi:hypothetical protein